MMSAAVPDFDGILLSVVRQQIGQAFPVICTLDCHAVLTEQMVSHSTAIFVYRTHPHVDIVETGQRAADLLLRILRQEVSPTMACRKVPMLMTTPNEGTRSGPLKALFDQLVAWDAVKGCLG